MVLLGPKQLGQLGDGTNIVRTVPAGVTGGVLFRAIAAGGSHTCALATDGAAYCWGRNATGQLGTGDDHNQEVPTKVAAPVTFVNHHGRRRTQLRDHGGRRRLVLGPK